MITRNIGLLLTLVGLPTALAVNTTDDASLLWGTYRPNLYFGMRPKLPQSFMTGLLWFGLQDYNSFTQIRHSCEQGDNLAGYTWTEHDARTGGVQVLKDPLNNLELTTELLKFPGGSHGGSWITRIKGRPLDTAQPFRPSLVYYLGFEGLGGLALDTPADENGIEANEIVFSGSTIDLGDFKLRVVDGANSHVISDRFPSGEFDAKMGKSHYIGGSLPEGTFWRAKDMIGRLILEYAQPIAGKHRETGLPNPAFLLMLPDRQDSSNNIYAIQKSFDAEFSFDVFFESASANHDLNGQLFTSELEQFKAYFDNRFEKTFPIQAPYSPDDHALKSFSKAITSNLFGGIGYFYGTSIVDQSERDEDEDDEDGFVDDAQMKAKAVAGLAPPKGLLTATPSRPFFPRGFYWDEGFHLLLVGAWDNDLGMEILKSWVNLIDEDGWVAREQILGEEARSKVPEEFQMQFPTYANPPTLTMAVTAFIDRLRQHSTADPMLEQLGIRAADFPPNYDNTNRLLEPQAARDYLRSIYPSLKRHYEWFRRTQRGQIKQWGRHPTSRSEGYRWRGRSQEHVLTSGLDDYPRAPAHIGELHVDLISWVGFFTRTMRGIAEFLGEREDEDELSKLEADIIANIDDLHWSEERQMYCDVSVDDDEESIHVCHAGYVSLFPIMLGLLPADSPHLEPILKMIADPEQLWSDYGIRSLSVSHHLFGEGENYWRGPIWMPMNYMILKSLHDVYANEPGPHQELARDIYSRLRKNIIDNVFKEYERTGYVWEQYDPINGQGRRSHPFTGWTSLVTLILAEKY